MRADPFDVARDLVSERFPHAEQAWLSGSVVRGDATPTSDLDITVLIGDGVVHRASLVRDGWPAELFVNTAASVRQFVAKDLQRRRPTMARLVASGVPLLEGDGGSDLQSECAAVLAAGPAPMRPDELELRRYALTDVRDDLIGEPDGPAGNAVAVAAWHQCVELLLAHGGGWFGSGKWLVRELAELDSAQVSAWTPRLDDALREAVSGRRASLVALVDLVLEAAGGPVWAGFRREA